MFNNNKLRKYCIIIYIPITILFIFIGTYTYRNLLKDFLKQNSSYLSFITSSFDDSLSTGNNLSIEIATNTDLVALSNKKQIYGTDILTLKDLTKSYRQALEINGVIDSIYAYLPNTNLVITQNTLYSYDTFYEKEVLTFLDGRREPVWYNCRKITSKDYTYISPTDVVSIIRQIPFNATASNAVIVINLNLQKLMASYSYYENVNIVSNGYMINAYEESSPYISLLEYAGIDEFKDKKGIINPNKGYLFYENSSISELYCTLFISKQLFYMQFLPYLCILILIYLVILFIVFVLAYLFSKMSSERSLYLINKIVGDNAALPQANDKAFLELDDAIERMVANNKLLADNAKKYSFLVQNMVISDIIWGNNGSEEELAEQLLYSNLSFSEPHYTGFVCVPSFEDGTMNSTASAYNMILYIKEIINKEISNICSIYSSISSNKKIFFFINHSCSFEELNNIIKTPLNEINKQAQNDFDISLYFSTGTCVNNLMDVAKSCYMANKLSDAKNKKDVDIIIHNASTERISPAFPVNISNMIYSGFKRKSLDTVIKSGTYFFNDYLIPNGYSLELCKNITTLLIHNLINELWLNNCTVRIEHVLDNIKELDSQTSLNDLKDYFLILLSDLFDLQPTNNFTKGDYSERYIPIVIDFIRNNYSKDLSNADIAACVNLNPRYLGELFKEATGQTLVKYLNTLRVHHSKDLLTNTNISIKDIAIKVGYNDVQSFIRHFKNTNNMTPTEYREHLF